MDDSVIVSPREASAFSAVSASSYAAAAYRSRAALKEPCAFVARALVSNNAADRATTTDFFAMLIASSGSPPSDGPVH